MIFSSNSLFSLLRSPCLYCLSRFSLRFSSSVFWLSFISSPPFIFCMEESKMRLLGFAYAGWSVLLQRNCRKRRKNGSTWVRYGRHNRTPLYCPASNTAFTLLHGDGRRGDRTPSTLSYVIVLLLPSLHSLLAVLVSSFASFCFCLFVLFPFVPLFKFFALSSSFVFFLFLYTCLLTHAGTGRCKFRHCKGSGFEMYSVNPAFLNTGPCLRGCERAPPSPRLGLLAHSSLR